MKSIFELKKLPAIAILIVLTGAFGLVLAGSDGPLGDRIDAVIIEGKSLPASMLGASRANYGLFVQSGSGLQPIPFQIDEKNKDGKLLMQKGAKAKADNDGGKFDANDELIFMAQDMGHKAGNASVAGCSTIAEISAVDSRSKKAGYAYLAKCSKTPAASKTRYIKWDAGKRTASTQRYTMGWRNGPNFHYDYLAVYNGPDLLDRLKVRVGVKLVKVFTFNEEKNFVNEQQGYIDGPVRISWVNMSKVGLGKIGAVPVPQYVYFFKDYVYLNNWLDTRYTSAIKGLDTTISIIHDLQLDRKRNYKLCANVTPSCEAIDGTMTPEREALKKKELVWGGVSGPEGTIITKFVMDPALKKARAMGVYEDDPKRENGPENIPGSNPEIGYHIVDLKYADLGTYYLDFYHYFMKDYSKAKFDKLDRLTTSPLKVTAKSL